MKPANSRAGAAARCGYTAAMRRTTRLLQPLLLGLVFAAAVAGGAPSPGRLPPATAPVPAAAPRRACARDRSGPARAGRHAGAGAAHAESRRSRVRGVRHAGPDAGDTGHAAADPGGRQSSDLGRGPGTDPPGHACAWLGDVAADAGAATAHPRGENRAPQRLAARVPRGRRDPPARRRQRSTTARGGAWSNGRRAARRASSPR